MSPRNPGDRRTLADLASNKKVTAGLLGATLGVSVVLLGATPALAQDATSTPLPVLAYATSSFEGSAIDSATDPAPHTEEVPQVAQTPEKPALAAESTPQTTANPQGASDPQAAQASQVAATSQAETSAQSATALQTAPSSDTPAPQDFQEEGSVIYNATEGSLAGDGTVAHGYEISATDTATGTSMDSGWNNNTAILDLTKSGATFDGHVKITNNSNERIKVKEIVFLNRFWKSADQMADPYRPDVVIDASRIQNGHLLLGFDNEAVTYCIKPGDYKTLAELRAADPNFSWSQIVAISSEGYLNPSSSINALIPLKLANYDSIKSHVESIASGQGTSEMLSSRARTFDFSGWNFYWKGADFRTIDGAGASVAVGAPCTNFMNSIRQMTRGEAHWDATVMTIDKDSTRIYDPAPQEIQDALKPLAYSDFKFINRGVTGDVLYTDGQFDIKLENAFDCIKDLGYTVNILPDGSDIWPYYSYSFQGAGSSAIHTNGVVYLQVSQVFDTQDLTLDQPGPWQPADNLVSAQIERYHQGTMRLTSSDNLKDSGDYDFELFDAHHQLVASGHGNQPVEHLAPGEYRVRYSYAINPTHIVTKTATITVADPDAHPTDPQDDKSHESTDPTVPPTPEIPSTESAAEKPAPPQAGSSTEASATFQVDAAAPASRAQNHVIPRLGDQGGSVASNTAVRSAGVAALVGTAAAAIAATSARWRRHRS